MKQNSVLNEFKGSIFFLILALMLAFGTYTTLGVALDTEIPIVAVVSNSMSHQMEAKCVEIDSNTKQCTKFNYQICSKTYQKKESLDFEGFWDNCGSYYQNIGLTKEEFREFPVLNGFQRGDLLVIMGTENYKDGDVVVYNIVDPETTECRNYANRLRMLGIDKVVHRLLEMNEDSYLVKGDHNPSSDPCDLKEEYFMGKVVLVVPKLGYLKLIPTELIYDLF